jgi:transposase
MCLFIKRLERGQFVWPMSASGTVSLTPGQLSTLLEGCEGFGAQSATRAGGLILI